MIYVNEEPVLKKGEKVIPLLCIAVLFDITQSILCCVCRGLGKQLIASGICFFNMYFSQTLLAIVFGKWLKLGVYGIWLGTCISNALSATSYGIVLFFYFDFAKIQNEVITSMFKAHQQTKVSETKSQNEELVKNEDKNSVTE